jgi:outer membrane protein TolC
LPVGGHGPSGASDFDFTQREGGNPVSNHGYRRTKQAVHSPSLRPAAAHRAAEFVRIPGATHSGVSLTSHEASCGNHRAGSLARVLAVLVVVAALGTSGCSRTFWRGRADREVAYLVAEKSNNPRWALPPGFNLNMDPRSRYYDPTNPDHPPMPPDDPYSHVYMHHIDGKRHSPWWHVNGELPQLPNPGWRQRLAEYCQMTPEGAIKLDLPGALALSYIHYPAHRQQLETLYLSAIDVSAERFRFNTQIYPGAGLNFLRAGSLRNGIATKSGIPGIPTVVVPRSQLTASYGNQPGQSLVEKEFATGGTLLVNFANSFVWQLAGPHTNNTNSLINLNFVQPLLRGGGRIITLETLTIAERTLLANLRQYERYRQGLFMNVSVGTAGPLGQAALQRRGGGFGGTGITGFTGQGIGGLGNVATAANFGGLGGLGATGGLGGGATGAVAGAAGGGTGNIQGFYGILQQQVNIDNAQNALNLQTRTLKLLEANLAAGLIDIAQVDIFRQSIETNKANLIAARIALENQKDAFKQALLGLPPDLPMVFDDPMIKQFQLIDPRLNDLQVQLSDMSDRVGELPDRPDQEQLAPVLADLDRFLGEIRGAFPGMRENLRTLESSSPARIRRMAPPERAEFLADRQRLNDRMVELETRFQQVESTLESLHDRLAGGATEDIANQAVALNTSLSGLAQEIALTKALAKLESIIIEPIALSTVDALQIARAHRLDWMNLRAAIVDQWRLICFNANALRSVLTLTVNGNLGTVGNNPFKFEANNGDMNLGVQFDPPLTRLLERNNYRQALIQYQQARRLGIQTEDGINLALRNDMRQLTNFEVNFEIQRQAVRIAIRRVDQTREALNQPPPPVVLGATPSALGPTAANNLLTALQALSDSQNNFISAWLQHYDERQQLYNDLGIMRLDERGMWIDEPLDKSLAALEQMYPLPPELPVDWLKDAGVEPPALYPTEGVPPLGGTLRQVQTQAATPETPRPQVDIQRMRERQPGREADTLLEELPGTLPEPPPQPPIPQSPTPQPPDGELDGDSGGAQPSGPTLAPEQTTTGRRRSSHRPAAGERTSLVVREDKRSGLKKPASSRRVSFRRTADRQP